MSAVTTGELTRRAAELGLDAVGVARAEAYVETERHIRERAARGLFGRLGFTTSRPEVSCHPERSLAGARSVVSAALCYYAPEPELAAGPRPARRATPGTTATRSCARRSTRSGAELGAPYRVLVDSNEHVDREAAARSGVGFYGKNTMLITPRHGSWVVLGTLVTAAELEPTAPLRDGLRLVHALHRRLPDRRARRAGRARRDRAASPTGRRCPSPIPEPYRARARAQVYGCDICQDVCPWNRGVERRRAAMPPDPAAHVDLLALALRRAGRARMRSRGSTSRATTRRFLRRNALVALGNLERAGAGEPCGASPPRRGRRRAARRARALGARAAGGAMRLRGVERWISVVRLVAFPFALVPVALATLPARLGGLGLGRRPPSSGRVARPVRARPFPARRRAHPVAQSLLAQLFDTAIATGYVLVFSFEAGTPVQQILYIDLAAACVRFEIVGGLAARGGLGADRGRVRAAARRPAPHRLQLEARRAADRLRDADGADRRLARAPARDRGRRGGGARAQEAELLRDELSRRADLADAAYAAERRTVEELRRLSSLRADFVSMVSHDVRTPMAAVIGAARDAARALARARRRPARRASSALIADEIDRLAALVGEVLDSSRIDEGSFSYSFGDLDLGALVRDAVAAAELGRDGIRITALGPARPARRSAATRSGCTRCSTNLIDNAVKYSPEGSTIEVRASAASGQATVEVVDRGAGIAPERPARSSSRSSAAAATGTKPGSGLGLYIARAIAEAHDGALEVSSAPGEGSTFTLRLPAA